MVRSFLAILLLMVTCSTIERGAGDLSQNNSVDKATLVDFDVSARKSAPDDNEPTDFIVATSHINTVTSALNEYTVLTPSFALLTRFSIHTRAPPTSTFA